MTSRTSSLLEYLTEGLNENTSVENKQVIARGFFLICCTNFFSKLADLLASPKITLTWLMQALGAPAFAISLIVPIRESGSMLPQLLLAGPVSARTRKAPLYQAGAAVQAIAIVGMLLTAMMLSGAMAGWLIVALVTLFSLGRCLCSLVSKAVLGKVIPKSLRGQTTGWSATIAGLTSCAVAAYLLTQGSAKSMSTMTLLMVASACWLLASLAYGFIDEPAESGEDNDNAGQSISQRLTMLRKEGVRVARKTYIVDLTSDHNRVEYVALSNSLIGALLLVAGVLLALLATFLSPIWLIATLSLFSLAGVALGKGLREA